MLQFEKQSRFGSQDNKVVLLREACLIQGQVELPEDVGNGHFLLIQGKLLSDTVPGREGEREGGREGGRERGRGEGGGGESEGGREGGRETSRLASGNNEC